MARTAVIPPELARYRDDWHMSPGLVSNGLIFLTGMTGSRPEGPSDDPEEQMRLAFDRVDSVLREAGLDCSRIVEMTTYHVGLRDHIDLFRRVRDEYVSEPYPAWTAIDVAGLVAEGAVIEIRVVADAS